jgi:hypothetical protein
MRDEDKWFTKLNMVFAIAVLFFANSKLIDSALADEHYGLAVSLAGLGTVITAALQYINRYEERAVLHRLVAAEYSTLRRELEMNLDTPISDSTMIRVQTKCDVLASHTPSVPSWIWPRVTKVISGHKETEEALVRKGNVATLRKAGEGAE